MSLFNLPSDILKIIFIVSNCPVLDKEFLKLMKDLILKRDISSKEIDKSIDKEENIEVLVQYSDLRYDIYNICRKINKIHPCEFYYDIYQVYGDHILCHAVDDHKGFIFKSSSTFLNVQNDITDNIDIYEKFLLPKSINTIIKNRGIAALTYRREITGNYINNVLKKLEENEEYNVGLVFVIMWLDNMGFIPDHVIEGKIIESEFIPNYSSIKISNYYILKDLLIMMI